MDSTAHIVAVPFPARGHINPMMNLCSVLAASGGVLVTLVVTEEYLDVIVSPTPSSLRVRSIPSVARAEQTRSAGFFTEYQEAAHTKMEGPFERLLDQLERPATAILGDAHLPWAVDVGNRRGLPVFALWMQAASVFTVFYHFHLLASNHRLPSHLSGREDERVDYIPGIKSAKLADLHSHCFSEVLSHRILHIFTRLAKARCILFNSAYEIEPHAIDTLKEKLQTPIFPIGPCIPSKDQSNPAADCCSIWLDSQPKGSVLYVSFGSFLSVAEQQMDEMALGLHDSGVRYLWVVRENHYRPRVISNGMGFVVPWCDQLRVLCHPSVGGFLTHCGWSSVVEGLFAGVPMLAFPLSLDQFPNSRMVVEDWKVGLRVKGQAGEEYVVEGGEIARLVCELMDLEGDVGKDLRRRVGDLERACRGALEEGGSSVTNLCAFLAAVRKC